MLIVDFENETESYEATGQTQDISAEVPVSDAERIEALESAILELAEVVLNG